MRIQPNEGPAEWSANPFVRLRTVVGVAGVYAVALLVWFVVGGRWPGGRWFGVHLFTLGIVTNLVLALSDHFARTLTHQGGQGSRWQLPIVNAGIVTILWGVSSGTRWAVAAGATVVVAVVLRSYFLLRRLRKSSLGGRFSWIVRSYERAHGAFVHGAILGALLGTGLLSGGWSSSARVAHLHVNVLGWAGITLLATIVFFGPTILRRRIEPGAETRAVRALRWGASGLTVSVLAIFGTGAGGTWAGVLRPIAVSGLLVYAWAVGEILVPVIRAARHASPSAGRPALVMASAWFAVVAFLDAAVVATEEWRYLDALGVAMLAGVLFQAIAASLGYLAPLLLHPDAARRADLSERINRHGSLRAIAWNAGVMLAALAAALGSQVGEARTIAARVGWGLMLATALGLGATILLPRPRRNATGTP